MPVRWTLEGDLLTLTFEGEYAFSDIQDAARAGVSAADGPVRLLVNAAPTALLPDAEGVKQRIELLQSLRGRLSGPVAIVATPGAMYGIARQIGQQAEAPESLTVRVFPALADAHRWMAEGNPPD